MARENHNTKNKAQKDFYNRYIKEQNYEPTIDESLRFETSNDKREDFSIQQASQKRKEPAKDIIVRHLKENWLSWTESIVGVILFFFFVTFQISLSKAEQSIENNTSDITNLENKVDKQSEKIEEKLEHITEKNHQQDLEIQKNSIMLEEKE